MAVIRLGVDGDTRVSGIWLMLMSLLRSRYTIRAYIQDEPDTIRNNNSISDEEWINAAEIEAVLRVVCQLSFSVQTESRACIGSNWLFILRAKNSLIKTSYKLVNVQFKADLDKQWDAQTQFADLPKIQVPVHKLGRMATNLIERLKLEFENYLGEPDDDTLLAMMLDP
jgi:hypothetical protein